MTYGEVVDAMIAIKTREEAQVFFDAVVEEALADPKIASREDAIARASGNLGYLMGYAPNQIDVELWESIGAVHPIFGKGCGKDVTPEEAFKMGQELAKKRR
jgi:hypothetical protein